MGKGRRSSERPLQKVLGQGANVNADNPLEVHDPKVGSLISYEGVTTADGAGDGSTLIDSVLATKPNYNGNLVIITSGAYAGQASDIDGATTGGTVTAHTAFDGQILRGTKFVIAAIRLTPAEVAAIEAKLEVNQYYDRVFFDSVNGIAGTAWPVGTPQVPSNTIADVITILAARNLNTIDVHGALTLGATMNHYNFFGHYHESVIDVVDLSGEDVDDSHFEGLIITGAQAGAGLATYKECLLYNMSGFRGLAENCALFGTLAVATGNADFADFDHCTSVHGVITVTIASPDRVSFKDFKGGMILTAQAAGAVLVRGISGYLEVDDMGGGTLDIYADAADIQINADCDGGTINIFGNARVTDNSAAGCTVNNYTLDTKLAGWEIKDTHAHANNIVWQEVLVITTTTRKLIKNIWLDFVNLTQNMEYRLSYKIDEATYRIFDSNSASPWTPALDDGVLIYCDFIISSDLKLELKSAVVEGAVRNIPYEVDGEDRE